MFNNKKANLLHEDVVFIILNLVFFAIMILFLAGKNIDAQNTAKQIALFIDSAKPGTTISMDVENLIKLANDKGVNDIDIFKIEGNQVIVKLKKESQEKYSFFNKAETKMRIGGKFLIIEVK